MPDPLMTLSLAGETYVYDPVKPNKLTDVKDTATNTVLKHYEYDDNGNIKTWAGKSIEYNRGRTKASN